MPDIKSLSDVLRMNQRLMPISDEWKEFIGTVPADKVWSALITGEPGAGKSTTMLLIAAELARFGKVLFFCAEERLDTGTIKQRALLLEVFSPNIYFLESQDVKDLDKALAEHEFRFVVVDSINRMRRGEEKLEAVEVVDHLLRNRDVCYFFVAQMEKQRRFYAGAGSIGHDVDIEWVCRREGPERVIYNQKNRFSPQEQRKVVHTSQETSKTNAPIHEFESLAREKARKKRLA